MRPFLNLYTHDGLFHADDVFATALLSLMAEEIHVTRGSDLDLPADDGSWIIFDIGGGELDHHTPENKERNGTHPNTNVPYAACRCISDSRLGDGREYEEKASYACAREGELLQAFMPLYQQEIEVQSHG